MGGGRREWPSPSKLAALVGLGSNRSDSSSIHGHFHLHLAHPKPSAFGLPALVAKIKISGEKAFTVVLIEIHKNY